MSATAQAAESALEAKATPQRAEAAAWFFKTAPGQYGHGDAFLGLTVPEQRRIAKQFRDLPLVETLKLLASPWHECRLTALFIMVHQFERGDTATQKTIYQAYLANKQHVNNWDLVDSSAHKIVGAWLHGKPKTKLVALSKSRRLWDRRIAVLATFYDIQKGDPTAALQIAELLVNDTEDLMQKAVGWMLREVGKRCDRAILEDFLSKHYKTMPRTTLRYAIEHFSPERRKQYLRGLA